MLGAPGCLAINELGLLLALDAGGLAAAAQPVLVWVWAMKMCDWMNKCLSRAGMMMDSNVAHLSDVLDLRQQQHQIHTPRISATPTTTHGMTMYSVLDVTARVMHVRPRLHANASTATGNSCSSCSWSSLVVSE